MENVLLDKRRSCTQVYVYLVNLCIYSSIFPKPLYIFKCISYTFCICSRIFLILLLYLRIFVICNRKRGKIIFCLILSIKVSAFHIFCYTMWDDGSSLYIFLWDLVSWISILVAMKRGMRFFAERLYNIHQYKYLTHSWKYVLAMWINGFKHCGYPFIPRNKIVHMLILKVNHLYTFVIYPKVPSVMSYFQKKLFHVSHSVSHSVSHWVSH